MRPPVKMRLGPRAFSRDCTEDSDIPLSCEMKDEPAFKILQGNPTFFQARESRYPLHVRQHIQGPSHIPIAEGRLLLRCCGNVAYLFNRILGISSLLEKIWGAWSFPRVAVENLCSYRLETGVSGNLYSFLKEVKPLVLSDVEHGIAMERMKGKWASSRVALGYTEPFCIHEVTAVFLLSCDSFPGDSLVFHQAH